MGSLLMVGEQTYEVEQLTDTDPQWRGIKVMVKSGTMMLAVGTEVKLQPEGSEESQPYRVSICLSPAAPRGWRVFLEPITRSLSPQTATHTPILRSDLPNGDKIFIISVAGVIGEQVRRSVVEYKVPFARLSQEVKRITKAGGKITRITEAATLGSLG
ncbi:MAG: phycobilisome linker polypeptide [Cyanobacteriota bacterium]|nr:phycobilisome linker polypeptide [Cyanobacteriota bacterium]